MNTFSIGYHLLSGPWTVHRLLAMFTDNRGKLYEFSKITESHLSEIYLPKKNLLNVLKFFHRSQILIYHSNGTYIYIEMGQVNSIQYVISRVTIV